MGFEEYEFFPGDVWGSTCTLDEEAGYLYIQTAYGSLIQYNVHTAMVEMRRAKSGSLCFGALAVALFLSADKSFVYSTNNEFQGDVFLNKWTTPDLSIAATADLTNGAAGIPLVSSPVKGFEIGNFVYIIFVNTGSGGTVAQFDKDLNFITKVNYSDDIIAAETYNGKLYVLFDNSTIREIALPTMTTNKIITGTTVSAAYPNGLGAFFIHKGFIYWTDGAFTPPSKFYKVSTSATSFTETFTNTLSSVERGFSGGVLDRDNDFAYVITNFGSNPNRINKIDLETFTIVDTLDGPSNVTVTSGCNSSDGTIYWVSADLPCRILLMAANASTDRICQNLDLTCSSDNISSFTIVFRVKYNVDLPLATSSWLPGLLVSSNRNLKEGDIFCAKDKQAIYLRDHYSNLATTQDLRDQAILEIVEQC